jgi:lycopene cyclase domain-containing protein
MKTLYLLINILSISIPLIVSFHPRIKLYKQWKYLIPAIIISMIPYIIWDIYFTQNEIWGFNETYLTGSYIFNLPIEEWLFFICIPYACVFTHFALIELWKKVSLSDRATDIVTLFLFIIFILGIIWFHNLSYTITDLVFALVILLAAYGLNKELLSKYYLTFLVMLVPFFIVNGLLTGSMIPEEVVWYNNEENLGIRLFTIPIEDIIYAFSLILLNLVIFEELRKKRAPIPLSRFKLNLQ